MKWCDDRNGIRVMRTKSRLMALPRLAEFGSVAEMLA